MSASGEDRRLFLVAGEHSGDQLGGPLLAALKALSPQPLRLSGVGGEAMEAQGCSSLFPLSDIAVMGPIAILKCLPRLISRVHQTVDAAVAMDPHALVILDSPEFTHAVARRVRRRLPHVPVIDYVSPSVWAWRPGRAKKMRAYINHILAILPFEPDAHKRLGGPPCTYVGHPLIERLEWIKSRDGDALRQRLGFDRTNPVLVVLPGSRASEITRMMTVYGETVSRIMETGVRPQLVIPVASGMKNLVETYLPDWPVQPKIVEGEADKFAAFRLADAALATSGTVTLELALAGTPMAVAYISDFIVKSFTWMLQAHSVVLPNLVLGENVFPEYLHDRANAEELSRAVLPLLDRDSAERRAQIEALKGLEKRMVLENDTPSERAARIVLDYIG